MALHRRDIPADLVVDAAARFHRGDGPTPDVALADRFPPKLILSRMEQLVDQGILEYGTSLRTAWPVEQRRDE